MLFSYAHSFCAIWWLPGVGICVICQKRNFCLILFARWITHFQIEPSEKIVYFLNPLDKPKKLLFILHNPSWQVSCHKRTTYKITFARGASTRHTWYSCGIHSSRLYSACSRQGRLFGLWFGGWKKLTEKWRKKWRFYFLYIEEVWEESKGQFRNIIAYIMWKLILCDFLSVT